VKDAAGQALAYVYSRKSAADAGVAGVLSEDEARRIANNIAKLPALLGAPGDPEFDFPEGGG
jgi:cytochrome c553